MQCDRCENQAAYTRKYSGEKLCSQCFSKSIVKKTAKTISKYNMIQHDELVAVAVSGGKDSLALLKIINEMASTHSFKIKAITIDEGIPGYRNEALEIVEKVCKQLNVEHKVYSYKDLFELTLDEALELRGNEKTSSCSICGTLRRRAMEYAAKDVGANVIATGHNLDDTLQTFVINMLSGDTTKIGWMDPDTSANTLRKIKPFCEIYESEIVFYAFTNDMPFQSEPCPHMNEGIRTEIREFLNSLETQHSGIKNNLYQSILKVSQVVKNSSSKKRRKCQQCGNECTGETCSVCTTVLKLKENQT
jgi:cytoplasmic tRNA 2-thiolation protein 1